ncbi:MAG: hypothetical protein ACD_30C00081G0002 [uncultured bacterium]|uniref:Uncharacterized protein n=3 Tax=Candidatus Daviesiibacteriota TaxID=1752718 RepID=A0A0G0EY92_9BACT|nr:MAG: hypothetical protein ACD_30C00081G0002 [uncultured bacterium]KKQ10497.1 MAG: hypothetical protein US19_C0004G0045 [Candidatus Daviesbacteria bacterium GW2011_GWB1_36_5]KKQ15678.1 MAG: hypothetical protein US28_C0012G0015 [Candidatus Daviesbacteria bacterium GW2011_GWA1_36_8]OGE32598.1 MAG: hypothetical protein A3C99_01885 [Candidatus Daviesbacteria bacterium RIFCSPHIGHO2_02_FULL_37_9]OGE36203.1 MAG: hypothetical protein A3E66_05350 [Candidatus Daviesbacteria bacterium RIFCSPHIGHO2_12_FU
MDNTQQILQIPPDVRSFLEGLLTDAGMTSLDDEMREEMLKELYGRLDNHLSATIIDNLPPENLDEFIKLNEDGKTKEEIESYLKEKMPNAQEVLAKAFIEFRDLYLGNVTVARNAPPSESQPSEGGQTN